MPPSPITIHFPGHNWIDLSGRLLLFHYQFLKRIPIVWGIKLHFIVTWPQE